MGTQDEQAHNDILASEVEIALTALARLAQQVAVANLDIPGNIASSLLKQLLLLCEAQRGALFLISQDSLLPEQEFLPVEIDNKTLRTFAVYNVDQQEAHDLLKAFPAGETPVEEFPGQPRWVGCRLPMLPSFSFKQHGFQGEYAVAEPTANPMLRPFQIVLIIGWTSLTNNERSTNIEKVRALLPRVADAVGAVIVNILLAERVHELELAMERATVREMELLKAELLATVSHELRSPLASIKGYAATLLRHERRISHEERHDFLLAIQEASNRLETIVDRLLEVSQLETDTIHINRSPTDVIRLAREAIRAMEERISVERVANHFTFYLRLGDGSEAAVSDELLVMADQRRLREVLDHLLENAMKYSPNGGAIDVIVRYLQFPLAQDQASDAIAETAVPPVRCTLPGEQIKVAESVQQLRQVLEICVCDHGMGIPPEHLDRIFERFHRVDTRLTREVNGLGLGLTICKCIIELHNGAIWAESCPAGGSAFHVWLPVDEEEMWLNVDEKENSLAPFITARAH
ncbi:MAG TPA: HAMP domain-containing sensor histidine kinase [Ktedonobacteraceae bacterium]|nr:HAMP domain-containing sensor histidine kinase [Ktedonobacteraceae bacterium]